MSWERRSPTTNWLPTEVAQLLAPHGFDVLDSRPLTGGLVNSLFRVETPAGPVVLRKYERDPSRAVVEESIGRHLAGLPVPQVLCRGEGWVVQTWMPGTSLTTALVGVDGEDAFRLGVHAAELAVGVHEVSFEAPGELVGGLTVEKPFASLEAQWRFFLDWCYERATPWVLARRGALDALVESCPEMFEGPVVLVHADYRPDNLLAMGSEITAILDWEFAFAGPALFDVGQLLRYEHEVSPRFAEGVLSVVGAEHRRAAALLDLVNLLHQASQEERPKLALAAQDCVERTLSRFR